ncbi:MAG TPA: hypothetical protein PKZ52_14455 [Cellvibrionaceae bacterium]|nr:hypothetical protein [Cellvibrionaceae bacterium]
MSDDFTKLTMGAAGVNMQCHPHELMKLNSAPFVEVLRGASAPYGYQIFLTGYSDMVALKEQELSADSARQLSQDFHLIKSNPRMLSNHKLNGSVDTWSAQGRYYRMDYKVSNGQVVIFNIQPLDHIQKSRDLLEKPSLYSVAKNSEGGWHIKSKVDVAKEGYGAVNGQSNNLTKATWLMGAHLEFEYGNQVKEFTLFHNPSVGGPGDTWESFRDKLGITTPVTKVFAEKLLAAQQANQTIKWVAHSQGGVIFAEAVRTILKKNKKQTRILDKQSIALHGNANNNFRSSFLFDKAGIEVIASRGNTYDLVYVFAGLNTLNPWRMIGAAVYWRHVFSGSVNQSTHTMQHKDYDAWNQEMTFGAGRGRSPIQKGFHAVDQLGRKAIKAIPNYLK